MNQELPEDLINLLDVAADELLQWHHGSTLPDRLMAMSKELSKREALTSADQAQDDDNPVRHWYALSFLGTSLKGDRAINATTFSGYVDQSLNMERILEAKHDAGLTPDSVMLGATYLGYMPKKDFVGKHTDLLTKAE